jgi:hypothetical protein
MTSNEQPHTFTVTGGKPVVIWADTTKLQKFLPTALPDIDEGPTVNPVSVPASSVSRYPGDPAPYQRGQHVRRVLRAERAFYQATPGQAFTVETVIALSDPVEYDVVQFTFTGAFVDLHALFLADAAMDLILRSPVGTPYEITVAPA